MTRSTAIVLTAILVGGCERLFIPDETEPDSLFLLEHDFITRPIVHPVSVTLRWTEVTIEHFKEFQIERAWIDANGTHWEPVTRLLDSLAVSYTDTVDDDVTYQYRIRIVDTSGQFRHAVSDPFTVPKVSTIQVPNDYSNLEDPFASKFLDDGDTLLVHAGHYRGNYRFLNKEVVIRSFSGYAETWIEGQSDSMSVVEINLGLLEGFTLTGGIAYSGGGLKARGEARVQDCIIVGNKSIPDPDANLWVYPSGMGGGVYLTDNAQMRNCRVTKNWAALGGAGILMDDHASLVQSVINSNISQESSGIMVYRGECQIRNSRITDNMTFGRGGGLAVTRGRHLITNSILNDNQALNGGGGILNLGDAGISILNCVLYNNTSGLSGGEYGALMSTGNIKLINSIVWNNSGEIQRKFYSQNSHYSDVEGLGTQGVKGNIDADPLFIDPLEGDFHLKPGSPCKDNGNPSPDYRDRDGSRNDMGAYGGPLG